MPTHFDQHSDPGLHDGNAVGISNAEIVELVTAFRYYGFFRIDLDSGLLYATPDVFKIFEMTYHDGPLNMVEFGHKIHPEDLPMVMEAFERASVHNETYHSIYRVRRKDGNHRFVRTVGKYREKAGTAGEVVGVTYEFFERLRTVGFSSEKQ
ncbi:PAS domain-containing protein [Agrobacterium sp. ES01]|uniref:PAS domain-containing protein n=1 Tax=Agrobacterium sp. ES01 TaxID=3420714 RepID=UPI003D1033F9